MKYRWLALLLPVLLLSVAHAHEASEVVKTLYPEAKHGAGELRHIDGLPVVIVAGTPDEIGEQLGHLVGKAGLRVARYPKDLLALVQSEWAWPTFVAAGKAMIPRFPPHHLAELEAVIKYSGVDRDLAITGNTIFDMKKMIACSSVLVDKGRSKTGTILFGRNLDFPTMGYLQHFSLVTVYKPKGKHAFVSVGFPGFVGVLSGMNDAGLCLAVHEVYHGADKTPQFDKNGVPFALILRRIMEECTTIDEAAELLRSLPRTTHMNLPMADLKGVAVLEVTTKNVIVRRDATGICHCTNHFMTKDLKVNGHKDTYETLTRYDAIAARTKDSPFGVEDVQGALHAANLAHHTLQTMVFEPETRTLYLATGKCPSSAEPLRKVELKELLK